MRKITLSIEDGVYKSAREEAAKRQTNVSAIVRDYLKAFAQGKAPVLTPDHEDEDRKKREELVNLFRQSNLILGFKPGRAETYER